MARRVAAFLMACASSSTTLCHCGRRAVGVALQQRIRADAAPGRGRARALGGGVPCGGRCRSRGRLGVIVSQFVVTGLADIAVHLHIERRREARGLAHPVAAHRGRRHHQRGAAGCALRAARPASAASCPGPCRRPGRRRNRWRPGASASGSPSAGSRAARLARCCGNSKSRSCASAQAALRLRHAASPSNCSSPDCWLHASAAMLAMRWPSLCGCTTAFRSASCWRKRVAQGEEVAIAERDVAALAGLHQFEQRAQAQHLAVVEREFAVDRQPVAAAGDVQRHRLGADGCARAAACPWAIR